jgi:hypothetical protein
LSITLDPDLQEAMEKAIRENPAMANWIRLYFYGAQRERNRWKEYPYVFTVLREHLKIIDRLGIPYVIHESKTMTVGLRAKREILTIGFKTKEDGEKAIEAIQGRR